MATSQLTGFEVYESNIVTSRLTGFEVFGTPTTATSTLTGFEVYESPASGPTSTLTGFEVFGTNASVTSVLSGPATVEPDDLVTFTLAGSSGSPDAWSIVQTSGPVFTAVDGNGSVARRFRAPFVEPVPESPLLVPPYTTAPIYAVFTGTATAGGTSATSTWQVQVYPHTLWGTDNGARVPILWWEGDPVAAPVAAFSYSPTNAVAPAAVAFRDLSSPAADTWLWNFGDGQTSPEQHPTHTYPVAGPYTVTLIVSAPGSADSDPVTRRVVIAAPTTTPPATPKPSGSFTLDKVSGVAPLTVAAASTSNGSPYAWSFDWGDDSTDASTQTATHTYSTPGDYVVTHTATNAGGTSTPTYSTVTVTAAPIPVPVTSFTMTPTGGDRPLTVQFTDTSSPLPASWLWTFGDGGTSTVRNPKKVYTQGGSYAATLETFNSAGQSGQTVTKTIAVTTPVAPASSMPTTSPAGWRIIFADDFTDQTALGTWTNTSSWDLPSSNPYYRRWRSNPDRGISSKGASVDYPTKTVDTPAYIRDALGVHRIHGHTATVTYTKDGTQVTEAKAIAGGMWAMPYPDAPTRGQKLGMSIGKRISVRYATEGGPGFGMAFFLWPVAATGESDYDAWFRDGETDYPEHDWVKEIGGFLHLRGNPTVNGAVIKTGVMAGTGVFHVATIEWVPGAIRLYLDGVLQRETTDPRLVHDGPVRWGWQAGSHSTANPPAASSDGELLVDWVVIEEIDNTPQATAVRFPDDEDMDSSANRWQPTTNEQSATAPTAFGTMATSTTTDPVTHVHYWAPASAVGNVVIPTVWVGTTVVTTGAAWTVQAAGDQLMPVTPWQPTIGQAYLTGLSQASGTARYQVAATAFAQGAVAAVGPMHASGIASPARFITGSTGAPTGTSTSYRRIGPVQAVTGPVVRPLKKRSTSPDLRSGGAVVKIVGPNIYDLGGTDNAPTSSNGVCTMPSMTDVNTMLDQAVAMGANYVRSHSLFINYGMPGTVMPTLGNYDEAVLVHHDKVQAAVRARGLWLMMPTTDRWAFYHGGIWSMVRMVLGDQSITQATALGIFYMTAGTTQQQTQVWDWYVGYMTTRANRVNTQTGIRWRDDPTNAVWESGNETWDISEARSDAIGQLFRSLFPGRLNADGSAASGETQYTKFDTSTMSVNKSWYDIVGAHNYTNTDGTAPHRNDIPQHQDQVQRAAAGNKAFVTGEFDWRNNLQKAGDTPIGLPQYTRAQWLTELETRGQGSLWWSMTSAGTVGHDDGYQLRADAPQNAEQTAGRADLAAHARRMRGLT